MTGRLSRIISVMTMMVAGTEQSILHTEMTVQEAVEGEEVRLVCPLEAGSLTVQWQKDDFGLGFDPTTSFPRYSYARSSLTCDLVIEEVNMKDSGVFTCIAVYPGQQVSVASSVRLEVMVGVSQPQILQDSPVVVVEGEEAVLRCMSQGKPAPEVSESQTQHPLTWPPISAQLETRGR